MDNRNIMENDIEQVLLSQEQLKEIVKNLGERGLSGQKASFGKRSQRLGCVYGRPYERD